MRTFLLILLLFITQSTVFAFVLENDSTSITSRSFNQKELSNLKKNYPYKYGTPKQSKKYDGAFFKALTRFIDRILGHWNELSLTFKIIRIALYLFGISFFLYLIIQILNIQYLFRKSDSINALTYQLMDENIGEMDFENLIQESVQQRQYRLAIRLHYLHTLRLLSEMKYIEWKTNKTNFNYVLEMQGKPSSKMFNQLTNIFDWVWYGEYPINEKEYLQHRDRFIDYKKSILD